MRINPAILFFLIFLGGCALPELPGTPPITPWSTIYGAFRDERDMSDMLFDKAASLQIKGALLNKDSALGLKVKVYCFMRRVTLLGQLADEEFKAYALASAWGADGVKGVQTAWVEPGQGDTTLADLEIASRLRAALVADEDLSATQIEAEVFSGQVFFVGMVRSQEDADRAVGHAREIQGVVAVTSLLIPTRQDEARAPR